MIPHQEAKAVAALCVSRNSAYKQLPGVECYDAVRDARTFAGGMPVVAHPPCRTWSAFCRQQVKATPEVYAAEQELGLWCAKQLREQGGVLEQPAHSHLWAAAKLPMPGHNARGDLWSIEVWQAWWGYPCKKATWLCFSGVMPRDLPPKPYRLHNAGADRRAMQVMSHGQRSRTVPPLAEWLVNAARASRVPTTEQP